MKVSFDDEGWQRLQDDLNAGQICGETAGKLYAHAKGAMQQSAAALVGQGDPSAGQAAHTEELLRTLRHAADDAARRFASAVMQIDTLAQQLGTEPKSRRKTAAVVREK